MTRIYIVSDLHLEFRDAEPPTPESEGCILVIAGDLGNPSKPSYEKYLKLCAERFKDVILVLGNHDYYSLARTMKETEILVSEICQRIGDNVHYLNCESITISGIMFMGCTLWSDLTRANFKHSDDFRMIKDMDIQRYQEIHLQQRAWLTSELKQGRGIVVTHHPPSIYCMHRKYAGLGNVNFFYYNDLDVLLSEADVWLCGHTHSGTLTYIKNSVILLNPMGYPGEINNFSTDVYFDYTSSDVHVHNFYGQTNIVP